MGTETEMTDAEPTLTEIGDLCRVYFRAREALDELTGFIQVERRSAVRRRMRALKARVAEASAARESLRAAVTAAPHLFQRPHPRTRGLEGVKVGWRKQPGKVEVTDQVRAIARVRERLPERADELIRVRESLDGNALKRLDVRQLAAIGARIVETDDEIVIATARDDLDKLVDALLDDGAEDARA